MWRSCLNQGPEFPGARCIVPKDMIGRQVELGYPWRGLSICSSLNLMQKTPNGSLSIICQCNWEGPNWLHCDGVGGPESCSAIMYWAPSNVVLLQLNVLQIILAMMEAHDLPCCDGVVSITGREKENSGESWWRLLVVLLLLLFPLCVWPTTSHNHLTNLGSDTWMKWNKRERK